jgi:hypothetical protein
MIHLKLIQVGWHLGGVGHAAFRLNDFTLGNILQLTIHVV